LKLLKSDRIFIRSNEKGSSFFLTLYTVYIYKFVFGPRAPPLCSGDIYRAKLFWTSKKLDILYA